MEERKRLIEAKLRSKNWQRFGPYLAERQWATVREDYSANGDSWNYFPHDHARSRAYRWGEDGLLGICDRECRLCFALALWNGKDPFLKERLFGLTSHEGNHGEDVKELYYYLDSTPTHSYCKALYKYPHEAFPYEKLRAENRRRTRLEPEFEISDTGIWSHGFFDIQVEYAKSDPENLLIRITVTNQSDKKASLTLLPTLWFRNTWSWGPGGVKPLITSQEGLLHATHETLGSFAFAAEEKAPALFTENETNVERLFGGVNHSPYVKDSFHTYVVEGKRESVHPSQGTKSALLYSLSLEPKESRVFRFRLFAKEETRLPLFGEEFEATFAKRIQEADRFYEEKIPQKLSGEEQNLSRQAYAGLLWNKQFYHYIVKEWLDGDAKEPTPPPERKHGRNVDWKHVYMRDVLSMPDKWEYPWFAAWDLGFQMIPFARIDPEFAKQQMMLLLREWYTHPSGQLPAYEYAFSDVNPPIHAWAAWRVYKIADPKGKRDVAFLESVFQKLLVNFTWWVNRKDLEGRHLFSGGFLGLDNIGVLDRSKPLVGHLQQSDATAWMGFYCLTMLSISLELAAFNPVYEDLASKFFEHFIHITDAMNECGGQGLWNEQEGFYYDLLNINGAKIPLKTRSLVGLLPLIAVEVLEKSQLEKLPGFSKRMHWFLDHRQDLRGVVSYCETKFDGHHRILAMASKERLIRLLNYLTDEAEFLSPFGIRSLSKIHATHPFILNVNGEELRVDYEPGAARTPLFGGNSNWRGPIWFPLNFLLIEALERYHHFYGEEFKVEYPKGSKQMHTLKEIAQDLGHRLSTLFPSQNEGEPPLFHEYFHAETGKGLGASHHTGWTALIAKLLEDKRCLSKEALLLHSLEERA